MNLLVAFEWFQVTTTVTMTNVEVKNKRILQKNYSKMAKKPTRPLRNFFANLVINEQKRKNACEVFLTEYLFLLAKRFLLGLVCTCLSLHDCIISFMELLLPRSFQIFQNET